MRQVFFDNHVRDYGRVKNLFNHEPLTGSPRHKHQTPIFIKQTWSILRRKILFSYLTEREPLIVPTFPIQNRLHYPLLPPARKDFITFCYPLLERDAWNRGMRNRGCAIKIFWDQYDMYLKEGERLLQNKHEIVPDETKFKVYGSIIIPARKRK